MLSLFIHWSWPSCDRLELNAASLPLVLDDTYLTSAYSLPTRRSTILLQQIQQKVLPCYPEYHLNSQQSGTLLKFARGC